MVARLTLASTFLAASLLGCASPTPRFAPAASAACVQGASETYSECTLKIEVLDCGRADGYRVSEPDLYVADPSRIEWEIVTTGYEFREDKRGIEILWNSGGVFEQPRPHGPRKFSWRDKHRNSLQFKPESFYYYIYIKRKNGADCEPFDPWISNW